MSDKPRLRYVGFAIGLDPTQWAFGWCTPVEDDGENAPSYENGNKWLCLGPLALMFAFPLAHEL